MKKPKRSIDISQYQALNAQIISYEVAIACLFEVLAKSNPTTAKSVAQAMKKASRNIPDSACPGLGKKIQQYIMLLESDSGPTLH